jgi:hypothetical protein
MPLDLHVYRKSVLHLAPVGLAAAVALQDALNATGGIHGAVPWWGALVAAATAAAVYFPGNPWVKAAAGLVGALAQVVTAALTDGSISQAELLMVLTAFLAWASSSVTANSPGPE